MKPSLPLDHQISLLAQHVEQTTAILAALRPSDDRRAVTKSMVEHYNEAGRLSKAIEEQGRPDLRPFLIAVAKSIRAFFAVMVPNQQDGSSE